MLGTGWRLAVVIGLASLTWNAASAMSLRKFSEIRFAQQSDALGAEQLAELQAFVCRVGRAPVEYVLAYSYAAGDEAQPQALAARRLQRVTVWLQENAPWDPRRTWAENKGATKLPAYADSDGGLLPNRQVLLEAALGPPFRSQPLSSDCTPPWQTALLASASTAPTVAAALVGQGFVQPLSPFLLALEKLRDDIFAALWQRSGIALSPEEEQELARKAWHAGRSDVFLQWVARDKKAARPSIPGDGDRWLSTICASEASASERVTALDALREAGARVGSAATMDCVLQRQTPLEVLDALLRAGGQTYLDADFLVASGSQPALLERLLASGLNPRVADSRGATLFHTMPLDSPATVQRLLDWGLDINAKAVVPKRYGSTADQAPLYLALGQCGCGNEVLEYMLAHGARLSDIGPFEPRHWSVVAQRWLVEKGIEVSAEAIASLAGDNKNLPVLAALLARGIDLNQQSGTGQTPLALAMEQGQVEVVRFLVDQAHVDLGPQRNSKGDNLPSALALAQSLGVLEYPVVFVHGSSANTRSEPWVSPERQARKQAIIAIIEAAAPRH